MIRRVQFPANARLPVPAGSSAILIKPPKHDTADRNSVSRLSPISGQTNVLFNWHEDNRGNQKSSKVQKWKTAVLETGRLMGWCVRNEGSAVKKKHTRRQNRLLNPL